MSSAHRFVIVASQRTGSTLLIRSLDSSPVVLCAGELFHAGPGIHHPEYQFPYQFLGSRRLARIRDLLSGKERVVSHLQSFYSRASADVSAVGFKLMTSHAKRHPSIMPFLLSDEVTFFFLHRRDTFATALSYYKAKASGVYHSDRAARGHTGQDLVADEREFGRLLDICRADKDLLLELHATYGGWLMAYEQMVTAWDTFIATLGSNIGVANLHVEKSLSRLDAGDPIVRVSNEIQLRERFLSDRTN